MGRLQPARRLLRWGAGFGIAVLLSLASAVEARPLDAGGAISAARLPAEARAVRQAIAAGGPFSYPKDGIVFANRERLLPSERRGYYREYTVPTPGARDRGARRIVCGGKRATAPDDCYYSDDHYSSFRRIEP